MQIWSLGSSSSGNAFLIEDEGSAILVDAGFSARETIKKLRAINIAPEIIRAILITHEHADHIRGARMLSDRLDVCVYMNPKIYQSFFKDSGIRFSPLVAGDKVKIFKFCVRPFSVPHDALDPLGLVVETNGVSISICIDLGCSTPLVEYSMMKSNIWIIESNHDPTMLKNGPYPWELKQRIAGPFGHLSNIATADLIKRARHDELISVSLVHLSETNNTPKLAYSAAIEALKGKSVNLSIAHPNQPVKLLEI